MVASRGTYLLQLRELSVRLVSLGTLICLRTICRASFAAISLSLLSLKRKAASEIKGYTMLNVSMCWLDSSCSQGKGCTSSSPQKAQSMHRLSVIHSQDHSSKEPDVPPQPASF